MKRATTSRTSMINNRKWFINDEGNVAYTYFERNPNNRSVKEAIVHELKKRYVPVAVLCKNLVFKSSGESSINYIIAVPLEKFQQIFNAIEVKSTKLKLVVNFDAAETVIP
jgi:hypothetical protein